MFRLLPNAIFCCSSIVFFVPAHAFSQAPFYEGKTITIIRSSAPGSVGDMRTRALIPFLRKHIPGNPTVVIQYMAGGGGRKAANYIYGSVRPDGLTIGSMSSSVVANAILGETGVEYDIDKLIFIGAPMIGSSWVFVTRSGAGFASLEELRSRSDVRVGSQTVGHVTHIVARLFAYLMGLKDSRFVTGYSGPELDLAMIRGELDARANNAEPAIKRYRDWISKGLVKFHALFEIRKGEARHPLFAQLPELESFAESANERKLVAMYRAFSLVGTAFVLPPGTSMERAQILNDAMRKALRDADFYKEYEKLVGEEPVPLMPEEQKKAIKEIPRETVIVNLMKRLAGPGPLPPR